LVAILGVGIGVTILFVLGGMNPAYLGAYSIIGLAGLMVSYPIARVISGKTPWYSPHAFVLAGLTLIYVLAPVAIVAFRMESSYFDRMLSPAEMTRSMLIATVGIAMYLLGYAIGPKKPLMNASLEWYFSDTPEVRQNFNFYCLVLYVAGIGAWAYMYVATHGSIVAAASSMSSRGDIVSNSGGFIYHIAKFSYVGCLLYFSKNGVTLVSLAMIGFLSIFLLLFGSRSFVLILWISTLIVYRFRFTDKIPLVVWGTGAALLFFMMTFYVLLRQTGGDLDMAARAYSENISTWDMKIAAFLAPFSFLIQMSEVVENMGDKIPWQNGRTFVTILYVIPSFLWKGQYEFKTNTAIFMEYLYPQRFGKVTLTPSIMAEFYMNYGWFAVMLCSLAMGWITRWFTSRMIGAPGRRMQVAWIVFSALVSVNVIRVLKNGSENSVFAFYFFIPMLLPYFPNIRYLFSPPPLPQSEDHDAAPGAA
jgi:hypothetical protein